MTKVFFLTVTDEHYHTLVNEVFTTEKKAATYLAKFCRGHWSAQHLPDDEDYPPLPEDNDAEAIARYFAFNDPEITFDITEKILDPVT